MAQERRAFLKKMGLTSVMMFTGGAAARGAAHQAAPHASPDTSDDAVPPDGIYNVFRFGAKGDGKTLDTQAIQTAIDTCNRHGGGKVYLQRGCFLISSIYMKSHVTLYIEGGAMLKSGDVPVNRRMILAENQHHISICGRGSIDGNGDAVFRGYPGPDGEGPPSEVRPGIIHFTACENIMVRDVTLRNAASWIQTYTFCKNIVVDGITVDSRENTDIEKPRFADALGRNTDGLNLVDSEKVRISNCFIYSGDDGIVLKSFSPDGYCRDITISNCVISTNASGIKIGTETAGVFEDVTIQNCTVYDTRNEAIALLTADGARVQRITISNISLRNIKGAAIGVRLGARNRLYRGNTKRNEPLLKDILIENIQGTRISTDYGCNISGLKNHPVETITLKNINLEFEGGGTAADSYREIPDFETSYPSGRVFGRIPAYGFFLRHVKQCTLENITLRCLKEDHRPAVMCEHVEHMELRGLKASATPETPELIRLVHTRDVVISESRPTTPVPVFTSVYDTKSDAIVLRNNHLKNAINAVRLEHRSMKSIVKEVGTM